MGRSKRGRDSLLREAPRRLPGRVIYVYCEGRRTERSYLRGLQAWLRDPLLHIHVELAGADPCSLVQEAATRASELRRAARRDASQRDDQVWAVFDRDQHARFHDACAQARDTGVRLAVTSPCFELWLLLHFQDWTAPGRTGDELARALRVHVPDFDKHVDFMKHYADKQRIEAAIRRAERLEELARENQTDRNPTSTMYELVRAILANPSRGR